MNKVEELVKQVKKADAILVGGGSGMSNAAGMNFWYEASPIFLKHMDYFYQKYHFKGIFNGFYNRFDSNEERWAFIIEALHLIFTIPPQKPTYDYLNSLIGNKPVHYITTNQDGLFKRFFGGQKVSEIQGAFEYFQSTNPKTDKKLYKTAPFIKKLLPKIKDHRLPTEDIPRSTVDGAELELWARSPSFLEDKKYNEEYQKINQFLADNRGKRILFLEMGVGRMTPMFIQEPFWEMTHYMKNSFYVNINPKDALTSPEIKDRSLLISEDINEVLKDAAQKITGGQND